MDNMILVGGVHGVGKTTFCNKVVEVYNLLYYSASELIASRKGEHFKNKKIKGINKNQDLLIEAVKELPLGEEWYLLDGHFSLLNSEGIITKVPLDTFINLSPKAIIFISDSIESILERLNKRDKIKYDINLLKSFQDNEREYSKEIAAKLGVPFLEHNLSKNEFIVISTFIKELIES